MGSWEEELDLDLSDIFGAAGESAQEALQQRAEDDGADDLAFPTPTAAPLASPPAQQGQSGNGITRLDNENEVTPSPKVDVADAPTQVASLTAEPFTSRGGSTVPLPSQNLILREGTNSKQRLPPLPSFQAVVSHSIGSTVPIPTQNLASRENDPKRRLSPPEIPASRNPSSREKELQQGVDIRKYFGYRGSSSGGDGGGPSKKPRIPGPVGDLVVKEQRYDGDGIGIDGNDHGKGNALCSKESEFNDTIFRKGAWISALQSLEVDEFDPARYAILKVTASSIRSSRTQEVPHFVAVIKELTPTVFGDAAVILKDPTGTVSGMMNNKVFLNTDYARVISPGAVIVLKQVAIFSPSAHYLNITINNVVQVFAANTNLPQGSKAPKMHQQQQEPVVKQEKPRSQPQHQPSPPRQEQPLSQPRFQPDPSPSPPQRQSLAQPQTQPRPSSPPQPPVPLESKVVNSTAAEAENIPGWDLMPPSPPSPHEAKTPENIAAAAKMAGWDLTDDMEALLNEDVDDFYA